MGVYMCIECFEKLNKFKYNDKQYIEWYSNKNYRIAFSDIPDIRNKQINKLVMPKDEIENAKKKPLFLANDLDIYLEDINKKKIYTFKILKGYDYDGASIARFLWRIIGSKENIEYKVASLIHDILCENHYLVDNDRYFADKIFETLLEVADVGKFRRWLMFHTVDNYQKFCGWKRTGAEGGNGSDELSLSPLNARSKRG